MKKLLITLTLCFLIVSFVYAFSFDDYIENDSPTIIDFIDDANKEKCELNKISTKECPTYSADHCIKDTWFIK